MGKARVRLQIGSFEAKSLAADLRAEALSAKLAFKSRRHVGYKPLLSDLIARADKILAKLRGMFAGCEPAWLLNAECRDRLVDLIRRIHQVCSKSVWSKSF